MLIPPTALPPLPVAAVACSAQPSAKALVVAGIGPLAISTDLDAVQLAQMSKEAGQVGTLPDPTAHRPDTGAMGPSEVQIPAAPPATNRAVACPHRAATAVAVCALAAATGIWLNNGSRMR